MTAPFPHLYRVDLSAPAPVVGALAGGGAPVLLGGAPVEFGGRDDWWNPERLLLGAVALCTMTTFQAFAARERLAITDYRTRAEGTVDKTPTGLAFTGVRLAVAFSVPAADAARARAVFARAEKQCLVANSLRCPVTVALDVRATAEALGLH